MQDGRKAQREDGYSGDPTASVREEDRTTDHKSCLNRSCPASTLIVAGSSVDSFPVRWAKVRQAYDRAGTPMCWAGLFGE